MESAQRHEDEYIGEEDERHEVDTHGVRAQQIDEFERYRTQLVRRFDFPDEEYDESSGKKNQRSDEKKNGPEERTVFLFGLFPGFDDESQREDGVQEQIHEKNQGEPDVDGAAHIIVSLLFREKNKDDKREQKQSEMENIGFPSEETAGEILSQVEKKQRTEKEEGRISHVGQWEVIYLKRVKKNVRGRGGYDLKNENQRKNEIEAPVSTTVEREIDYEYYQLAECSQYENVAHREKINIVHTCLCVRAESHNGPRVAIRYL